jgi:hypothetical protein
MRMIGLVKGSRLRPFLCGIVLAGLVFIPCFSGEQGGLSAELGGFIFEEDGTTPIEQAELIIEKIPEGRVYRSGPADGEGLFRIQDVERGLYRWWVGTPGGRADGLGFLGIRTQAGGKARVYIALSSRAKKREEASIVAGNPAVVFEMAVVDDQPREAGPFRIR